MSPRPSRQTYAAFCEEFDEDANIVLPETRKVANVSVKRSRPELAPAGPSTDISSDSGYSSRTVATVGSGDSFVSSAVSPNYTSLADSISSRDTIRQKDRVEIKERDKPPGKVKERKSPQEGRPPADRIMPAVAPPSSNRPPSLQRVPSKTHRREGGNGRHPPGVCWECDQLGYSNGRDSRPMDSPGYFQPHRGYDIPQSPQASRYAPVVAHDMHPPSPAMPPPRQRRPSSYHPQNRPVSYHSGSMQDVSMMYMHMGQPSAYGHGPPPSASAYAGNYLPPSPYLGSDAGFQQAAPPSQPRPRAPSVSQPHPPSASYEAPPRPRQRAPSISQPQPPSKTSARRQSVYGRPVVEYHAAPPSSYNSEEHGRRAPREQQRARRQSRSYDPDEDYYRMPPPPAPTPKYKQPTQVIPINKRPVPRKSSTTSAAPTIHTRTESFDMADVRSALPSRMGRKESRDAGSPERRPSAPAPRNGSRTSYYDAGRAARIIVADSRRRRPSVYGLEQPGDMERKQREAEQYQAARNYRPPPLTVDALRKKESQKAESEDEDESESEESSSESQDSEVNTRNGSNVGSRADDDSFTMIFRGVKIGLSSDTMEGRKINLRSGEEGQLELNIEGGRRPKKYLMSRSDTASMSSRREIEDVRRIRDDGRSDRESRHSSRSGFSGRGLLE